MKIFYYFIFLMFCTSSSSKAGTSYSKPKAATRKVVIWEQVWLYSSYLRSPLKDKPIKNIRKNQIRKLLDKTKRRVPIEGSWSSKHIYIFQNKKLFLPKHGSDLFIFASLVHFTIDHENSSNQETTQIKYLPLYKTGDAYPCAIIVESELLDLINEDIPEGHFSKELNVSNFGKYRAKTVDNFQKVFLHMNLLPSILNAIGLKLPDDAEFELSHAAKSIRVNRFYHHPDTSIDRNAFIS
ncbi:MAG: hypothetical protein AB8G05_00975 [Oligoflexales bacterium]